MLHENNVKVLMSMTAEDFVKAYYEFSKSSDTLEEWFSNYFPENADQQDISDFLGACMRVNVICSE